MIILLIKLFLKLIWRLPSISVIALFLKSPFSYFINVRITLSEYTELPDYPPSEAFTELISAIIHIGNLLKEQPTVVTQGVSHNAGIEYLKMLYFLLHSYLDPFVTPLLNFSAHILSAFRLQACLGSVCHSLCDCAVPNTIWSQGVFHLGCFF